MINRILPEGRGSFLCEGSLEAEPEVFSDYSRLNVKLSSCQTWPDGTLQKIAKRARLVAYGEPPQIQKGQRIRFQATLKKPANFQNPGGFNYVRHLKTDRINLVGSISNPQSIGVLSSPSTPAVFGAIRGRIRQRLTDLLSADERSFLLAILINERSGLSAEIQEAFRASGVIHILSISGLHVGLLALFLWWVLRPIFLLVRIGGLQPIQLASLGSIPILWLYVGIASWPVSGVRAAIMASLILVFLATKRNIDPILCLIGAAFFILLWEPLQLFEPSFQLSFAAVAGIFLLHQRGIGSWDSRPFDRNLRRRALRWVLELLLISFVCFVITAPIVLYHFHQISLAGWITNLLVVPIVSFLILPVALIGYFATGLLGLKVSLLWKLAGLFSTLVIQIVEIFSRWTEFGLYHGSVASWWVGGFLALLFFFAYARSWVYKCVAIAGLVALVAGEWIGWGNQMGNKLRITFLDVGQGDCTVVQFPAGDVWVIDGGGIKGSDFDIGRHIVAPALWEMGIRRADYLFLTHPHHDHYKGLGFIAKNFGPKVLFTNGDEAPVSEFEEWQVFLNDVKKSGVGIKVLREGSAVQGSVTQAPLAKGVELKILMPGKEGVLPHLETNDNSMTLKMSWGDFRILIPGDLMELGEVILLEKRFDLRSDVLKIGHHGSKTSTQEPFLDAVRPKYAVISAGTFNQYGVPDPEVLQRLEKFGVQILRTDLHGAITFETDGKETSVQTFVNLGSGP